MKLFVGGIAFFILSLGSLIAQDDTIYVGNASGSLENPNDFSNGAPNANLYVGIVTGGEFSSGVSGIVNGVNVFTITESANDQAAGFFVESGFEEENDITVPGTVNLVQASGTTLTIGQNYDDGLFVANQVTFNVSGGTVDVASGGIIVGYGDFESESVGSGQGTLNFKSETFSFISGGTDENVFDVGFDIGAVGTVTESGSSVVFGDNMVIGASGGTGTYNLQSGSLTLNDEATLGDIAGSVGTLNQTGGTFIDTSTTDDFVIGEAGTGNYLISGGTATIDGDMSVGDATGGVGTVSQSGGTVTIDGDALVGNGGSGTYTLSSGTANLDGNLFIGDQAGSTGNFTQSGGNLTVMMDTEVGVAGTGTFTFSGGTATFDGTVSIGMEAGSNGSFVQNGGNLTFGTAVDVGVAGTGTYNISAGTAQFNEGLVVGSEGDSTGTFKQTGGTVTIASGQTLALDQANSVYNLNGGTLVVGDTGGSAGITGPGSLNFGGGTLQAQGVTLTDSANGTISSTATISGAGSTINLEGNLSGAGQLIINGDNSTVVNLTGTDTYQGGTTVNDGLFNADVTSLPNTGPVTIATGATLNLTGAVGGSHELFSSLNGGGTFDTGDFNLELAGKQNFNGTINIGDGGSLQVFSGSLGNLGASTGSLIVGGDDTVASTGTVTLTGPANYTGTTTIDQGFTLLARSLASTQVTNMGSIGSTGAVGNVFLVGGGTGNLNQPASANPSTLLVRLAGPSFDSYSAGTANLFGDVGVSGYGRIGTTTYTIVNTTGGLTTGVLNESGPGGLIAISDSPVLLQATLTESGTQLFLDVTQRPITDFADTPNQRAVANALDVGLLSPSDNNPIFTAINTLTAAEIPGALDQLTPRPYLYMRDIAFENSTFLAQRIDGVLANIRTGFSGLDTNGLSVLNPGMESSLGQSLGSLLAYNNEGRAPNGVNYYPVSGDSSDIMQMPGPSEQSSSTISDSGDPRMAPTVAPPPPTSIFDGHGSGYNEFISGDVILGDLNQNQSNNNEPKAHYTAGNATAGVSFRMTSNLAAGVLFDYNHTDAKTDTQGSHVKVDSYSPGLFATYFKKGFYVNGLFTFGYNNYSDNRAISFGGANSNATSSPNGQQYAANLSAGYDFHPDPHWVVGPTASLGYTHLDIDSFTETGSGPADLAVDSQSADSLRARIGGHVLYQVHAGSILFQPNLSLSYQHEFLDDDFNLDSQLDIPGTPGFATQGTNSGRDTGLISLGLTATLDNSMSLYLDYLAEYGGSDYFIQSVEGGLKASF